MQIRWRSVRHAAIAGVVSFGLAGAVQTSPLAAEGNSAAADACQEGGYSSLVGVQDGQITTFGTTGECVSYAARGGRLVAASVVQPCLNGGYANLARSDTPGTAFTSEAACVSYAARGGELVPVTQRTIDISLAPHPTNPSFCVVTLSLSGYAPNTTYPVTYTLMNPGPGTNNDDPVTTDATGSYNGVLFSTSTGIAVYATVDGMSSPTKDISTCS